MSARGDCQTELLLVNLQENDKIVSELKAAEQATREAEQRIERQALEIELTHATIAKLEQVPA